MNSCLRRLLLGNVFALAALPALAQTVAAPAGAVDNATPPVIDVAPPAPPAAAGPVMAEEMDALSFVTWASASVRAAPNGTAALQETLPFGTQVIVTGRLASGGWVRVQTPKTPV